MKRVKVDFSTTVRGGLVRASQHRATPSALLAGDHVEAFDPEEGLTFTATVVDVDADGKFAYLNMDWENAPAKAVPVSAAGLNFVFNVGNGVAPAAHSHAHLNPFGAAKMRTVPTVQYAQSA